MSRAPTLLVVEHEAACPPARLGDWLRAAGCALTVLRPYAGDALPADPAGYDGLVVLGGSMGANDDDRHSWLAPLRGLIRDAVRDDVPVLGICLGHQVVATALGGRVAPNPLGQQVGLTEVRWSDDAAGDPLVGGLTGRRRGIFWNDDVVTTLPEGTTVLAQTERDEVQAARFAATAWGVQWHPEADEQVAATWAAWDRDRHRARGVDSDAHLGAIAAARDELERAWRPLATAFAALAAGRWEAA